MDRKQEVGNKTGWDWRFDDKVVVPFIHQINLLSLGLFPFYRWANYDSKELRSRLGSHTGRKQQIPKACSLPLHYTPSKNTKNLCTGASQQLFGFFLPGRPARWEGKRRNVNVVSQIIALQNAEKLNTYTLLPQTTRKNVLAQFSVLKK